jgi:hypothetical protein
MNAPKIWKIIPTLLVCGAVGMASAKLPPPPPVDPVKAEEAKKKAAETAKKDADDLGKAQDRAVNHYKKQKGGAKPTTTAKK